MPQRRAFPSMLLALTPGLLATGCLRQVVINSAADALAGGSGDSAVFASDNDPELVADALPFALKTMEALLTETPEHRGLLLALASGFTQYGQGFVLPTRRGASHREVDRVEKRVKRLHLRAHGYGLRALEVAYPGFTRELNTAPQEAAARVNKADVDLLYWTGAPLTAAISLAVDDMALVAELPKAEALITRAMALDPDWDNGSLHELFISYEGRSESLGGSAKRAQEHFARAVSLSAGQKASPYVALAEAVSIKNQDRAQFEQLMERALAIDPDLHPDFRLANLLAQEKARWMLANIDDLFL